jgi:hypothetical protein
MGQRPTHRNESQDVTPAKAGVHVRAELDSRFRGNDVTFDGAKRGISLWKPRSAQGQIPLPQGGIGMTGSTGSSAPWQSLITDWQLPA